MRKVVIGRGHECDVIVDDETDVVSRRQAVIAFTPLGRMTIYDLSTNGTFVNGIRVPKPSGYPLRRTDKVNFGSVCEFDLRRVRDPYRGMKIIIAAVLALMALAVAAVLLLTGRHGETATFETPAVTTDPAAVEIVETPASQEASLTEEQPEVAAEPSAIKRTTPLKTAAKKEPEKGNDADKIQDGAETVTVGDYSKEKDSDELSGKY